MLRGEADTRGARGLVQLPAEGVTRSTGSPRLRISRQRRAATRLRCARRRAEDRGRIARVPPDRAVGSRVHGAGRDHTRQGSCDRQVSGAAASDGGRSDRRPYRGRRVGPMSVKKRQPRRDTEKTFLRKILLRASVSLWLIYSPPFINPPSNSTAATVL